MSLSGRDDQISKRMLWLLTLLACGRDDILEAADEHATAAHENGPSAVPDEAAPGGSPGAAGRPGRH